jgi:hypothetical protein
MIKQIIDLLKTDHFYGIAYEIEVAKGRYKAPETVGEGINNIKRQTQWQKKKQ